MSHTTPDPIEVANEFHRPNPVAPDHINSNVTIIDSLVAEHRRSRRRRVVAAAGSTILTMSGLVGLSLADMWIRQVPPSETVLWQGRDLALNLFIDQELPEAPMSESPLPTEPFEPPQWLLDKGLDRF